MVGEKIMKKTLVVVLLILSVITGCGKNTDFNNNTIKICAQSWGHYVYEYYDIDTGVRYICTTDGGITPKVNSSGYVYETNR